MPQLSSFPFWTFRTFSELRKFEAASRKCGEKERVGETPNLSVYLFPTQAQLELHLDSELKLEL